MPRIAACSFWAAFPPSRAAKRDFITATRRTDFGARCADFFGEEAPKTAEDKRDFLLRRKIALWDVVTSCEIKGSADASIREEEIADLPALVKKCGAPVIFCNGAKSYETIARCYPALLPLAQRLPSTSPANPRFSKEVWERALSAVFGEVYKKS